MPRVGCCRNGPKHKFFSLEPIFNFLNKQVNLSTSKLIRPSYHANATILQNAVSLNLCKKEHNSLNPVHWGSE